MRPLIKLLLWLFVGATAVLAGLVALLFFVDVNLHRGQIEQRVSAAFEREVVFDGPLILEPSLTPRFAINGLKIANPDWASRPFLVTADKFDIRVGLLPLLRGNLKIVSLEFHGVDLLLEKTSDGANNFTFGEGASGKPTVLPAIERMSLYDATVGYLASDRPVKRLYLDRVGARKVPGEPVNLEAQAVVNAERLTVSLRGEPPDDEQQQGPWRVTLLGEADDLSLQVAGSVTDLSDWSQGEYRLELNGRSLDTLATLSGYALPEAGPFELGADIRFKLDEYVTVSDFSGRIGASDIAGTLRWDIGDPRSAIKVRLQSQHLDIKDLPVARAPPDSTDRGGDAFWDRPLELDLFAAVDVDLALKIQRFEGLAKSVREIALHADANAQRLSFVAAGARIDATRVESSGVLPWAPYLKPSASDAVTLKRLLQDAELQISAQASEPFYAYATTLMGRPLALTFSGLEATARPGVALTIRAQAALNAKPVAMRLQGEPLAALLRRSTGPWRALALQVRGDDIHFDASGSLARPWAVAGFDVSYALNGPDISALLPLQGSWSLTGRYVDDPDRHVIEQLKLKVGDSDLSGRVLYFPNGRRPRLVARLNSDRLSLDELLADAGDETSASMDWDKPLALGELGAVDLDLEARIQWLEGLEKSLQGILLGVHTKEQTLVVAPVQGVLDGTRLEARLQLPWGGRLAALDKGGVSLQRLLRHTDLKLQARVPEGKLHYRTTLIGHPLELGLSGLEATARPGEPLQVRAKATLDNVPMQAKLRAEPLAELLHRPTGPWQDLSLEVEKNDIRLQVSGSITRPFEASGFDLRYALKGAEIDALLPLFDLILPLEGPYSLSGHFADLPDKAVFDELKLRAGRSDIAGSINVYQGKHRPRVELSLNSEQIYLKELLPVSDTPTAPRVEQRVIPDYELPIEQMLEIDGSLEFTGKRLRTDAGDLGDIRFSATLTDGLFRSEPFQVRGWAGAFIESGLEIDASQDPPLVNLQASARQLDYGQLLAQAGHAETAEGKLDITLRLSGSGRTRHEILGNADGKLIIVGQEAKFGSRRLDLWGSDLVTTMLSRSWRRQDLTHLNCLVARINIEDGVASSDNLLVDTRRITIGGAGILDLKNEKLNLVFAPRPKRASLVSLTNPVRLTGTLTDPKVAVTVLPRNRLATAGGGLMASLINPGYLIFAFSNTGTGQANPCVAAVAEAMAMKGRADESDRLPAASAPKRFSLLPGCTPMMPR